MVAVIQKASIQGVSTRSVDDRVRAMGMTGVSKRQVSRLCEEMDERVIQRRCMSLETLATLGEKGEVRLPALAN
jgi:transposase-like protein